MALELGELVVTLGADTSDLKKAEREVKNTTKKMDNSFKVLGKAVAAAFSFDAIRRITLATDALNVMERRLKRFTGSSESAEKTFKKLVGTANAVGAEIKTVSSIFERFSLIKEDIGATNDQIIVMTDTLAKLGAIGGSSGEEIGRALVQLSQGLAGGVLRAEEFNSIIEQTPEIAKAIGENMGLSLGEMRKAMLAGELTSKKVFKAILDATEKTNKEFEKMPRSIAMASQALTNDLLVAFTKMDDALGFTNAISAAMTNLARQVRGASGELSDQEKILDEIAKTEVRIVNVRRLLAKPNLSGTFREKELKEELDLLTNILSIDKKRLDLSKKKEKETLIEITKGTDLEGPVPATAGELEKLAEKLELRFALTADANLKLEAEELRHRAAILTVFKRGSDDERQSVDDLNTFRTTEQARIAQEELDAANQLEIDKINVRQAGLSALSDLIGEASGLIAKGMEDGNAAAKAAFIAMKAIQVAQIIAATQVAAMQAAAAVSIGGPAAFFATAGAIEAIGFAKAGIVAGLSIGKVAGGRRHGGLSSPNMPTPINESGVPEILEQSGKQFLLPSGKAGKVSPISQGTSGGQPSFTIINNGAPIEVESMSVSRNEITMMISNGVKSGEKRINQSLASGRGEAAQSLQKGFRTERRL